MDTSNVSIGERRAFKAVVSAAGDRIILAYVNYNYPTYCKVYGVKVIRNGDVVVDIVPAVITNDGKALMYDTENSKCYFSTTGTDFTAPTV